MEVSLYKDLFAGLCVKTCTFVIICNFLSPFLGWKSSGEPFLCFFFGGGAIRVYRVEQGVAAY